MGKVLRGQCDRQAIYDRPNMGLTCNPDGFEFPIETKKKD